MCCPSNVVGRVVQLLLRVGAISAEPPATPDSLSVVSATTFVGSVGSDGSIETDGGASSILIVVEFVAVLDWPWGSIALFHAMQLTVCVPSPLTVSPPTG